MFSCKTCEIFKNTFKEHLEQLHLIYSYPTK